MSATPHPIDSLRTDTTRHAVRLPLDGRRSVVEMLKVAAARLDRLGSGWSTLHGDVPADKRPALLDRFRANPDERMLLSSDASGVGLNLQVANYVVHLDPPWSPARLDRRTPRAHRLGQTRSVS